MKVSTLNTLLVAKAIFQKTKSLVNSGDKHSCTAGIILLQDFVELVIIASLDELDTDEQRNLESKSFDELLGELKKLKVPVIKSGTIKALNKQRVICKHYGQLSEPASVISYFNVATAFVDALLESVVGAKLQEIFLTDILQDGPAKDLLKEAVSSADKEDFLSALTALRKAFFISYEREYCIYSFRNSLANSFALSGLLGMGFGGGVKAHSWTKNKSWIDANVKTPIDYIQFDYERFKTDCMEWGVSTVDAENFRRLTPRVVETETGMWHSDYDMNYAANELNAENFNYCLDVGLDFLLKKQEFEAGHKWPKRVKSVQAPPVYIGKPVFESPSLNSSIIDHVRQDHYYTVNRVVSGFNAGENYLHVHLYPNSDQYSIVGNIWGYLLSE
ncbi:hypothetical protein [Pseudomonas rhodesiae]|uniref:hypothetical protein n=1 Tax=Pseudomonas rhodesiae TaxID=76760 RepID=UPI000F49A029|nr:hypothetical protein [Pseudomonas rhodesiae]ROM59998.1 hypothetical protein BK650_00855 [Pseudomonas rhodesiae]ROM68480.1 hypothetical protein BK651_05190 [Pseudomonas rhodesiae]